MEGQGEGEGGRDGLVGYVVVAARRAGGLVEREVWSGMEESMWEDVRGPNTARGDDEIIVARHAPAGLYNLPLVIGNDLDALEGDAEREAELCKVGRVCVDRLQRT